MPDNKRLIQPPPGSSRAGRVVIFTASALYAAAAFLPDANPYHLTSASILLTVIAFIVADPQAVHIALFNGASAASFLTLPMLRIWPYTLLVPLLVYATVVLSVPKLRGSVLWIKPGRLDRTSVLLIITSLISGIALYAWYRLLDPDLSIYLVSMPRMNVWLLPFAGIGFSLLNAAVEEAVFRGIIMQALDSAAGPGRVSITMQAALFGAMHYLKGFPNGEWGLAMTFVYGLLLGIIRRRSQGMLAPWLAHVCVDMVVFTILAGAAAGR